MEQEHLGLRSECVYIYDSSFRLRAHVKLLNKRARGDNLNFRLNY
jgi:hypothetical protein